jgi:hypothetical protein
MSTVWAVPRSTVNRRQILNFLEHARCFIRAVEVRLFKTDSLYCIPIDSRRCGPSDDLSKTAQEIAKYIADKDAAEAPLVAADEV